MPAGIAPRPDATTDGNLLRREPAARQRRARAARRIGAVTARAARREDRCPSGRVSGGRVVRSRRRRRERMPLREPEGRRGDDEQQRERLGGASHQNPNRTFVKYQRLEVSQSVVSTAASEPPSTGSTHGA